MTIATPEEIKRGIALYEQWRNENAMNEKVIKHKAICDQLNELYARKNHDYGDSFHQTFVEEGMAMPRIRLGDKFSRFKTLSSGQAQKVSDESIVDTLMDMANYAIMTILELTEGDYDILYADGKPYAALKGNGHVAT